MVKSNTTETAQRANQKIPHPQGRIKIIQATRSLLGTKDFNSITTAEIARESGFSEALIYRYFKEKRDLLYQVLADDLEKFNESIFLDIKGIKGALNKLRKLIWSQINYFHRNRILARILLLEARSYPGYFKSEVYSIVKEYANLISTIVNEGVETGEIRTDISKTNIRRIILGSIEYMSLSGIILEKDIDIDVLQEDLCTAIFDGITNR